MTEMGRYFIRVIENNRVFVKSNTTGRSELLQSIGDIPKFIEADILNEVFVPSVVSKSNFELTFGDDD